jgi:hypothetical protein
MANINVAGTVQDKLNRCLPAAKYVRLGDLLNHLITNVNALQVTNAALLAKLDTAGGTVAGLGTNYTSTLSPVNPDGTAMMTITTIENR